MASAFDSSLASARSRMSWWALHGRERDQVISRSASADLIRHPGYQERIVVMADYHCEAGTAHILVDRLIIASGATAG